MSVGGGCQLGLQPWCSEPPSEETESEASSRKAKIKWPSPAEKQAWEEMDEDLTRVLELGLKGEIQNMLSVGRDYLPVWSEKFGTVEVGKEKQKGKVRREMEIKKLRQRVHQVTKQ